MLRCARNDDRQGEVGRSMIEMLGVLAIIGVLSVGGIAGYYKAMQMLQTNQQRQILAELLSSFIRIRQEFGKELLKGQQQSDAIRIIDSLGELPSGLSLRNNGYYYDKNGNSYRLFYGIYKWSENGEQKENNGADLAIDLVKTSNSLTPASYNLCTNAVAFAKANIENIGRIMMYRYENDSYNYLGFADKSAVLEATPDKIAQFCKQCTTQRACVVFLYMTMN